MVDHPWRRRLSAPWSHDGCVAGRLAGRIAKLRPDVLVLDGEVAIFDEQLVSRFHLLGDPDPTG